VVGGYFPAIRRGIVGSRAHPVDCYWCCQWIVFQNGTGNPVVGSCATVLYIAICSVFFGEMLKDEQRRNRR
jgi:hypothetical protein